jgi:acetyl-CoA acetyltransferase
MRDAVIVEAVRTPLGIDPAVIDDVVLGCVYGLQTMREGGGQANATILELLV